MPFFKADELAQWANGSWLTEPKEAIRGVSKDTRTISSGELYVALSGENYDGHNFLLDAFERGASAAMISQSFVNGQGTASMSGPCMVVDDTRNGLKLLAIGYRRKVDPDIIAVTGSAGKTTVKELAASVLSRGLNTAGTPGNLNNDVGVPLSILGMSADTEIGVFEVGMNHPGELSSLCDILSPKCGVITSIGPAHIEFFEDVKGIAEEKRTVLECLPEDGLAVLDRDGEFFEFLSSACACKVVTISLGGDADYVGDLGDRLSVTEASSGESHTMKLPLPGPHQARNALLAIALGRRYGISWAEIEKGLSLCNSLPMRWNVFEVDGITVVDDSYNANPVSMRAAILTFEAEYRAVPRWLVLGDMLELGERSAAEHDLIGEILGTGDSRGLVLVGNQAARIGAAAQAAGISENLVFICRDVQEACVVLREELSAGDAVLLKGSRGVGLDRIVKSLLRDGSSGNDTDS